MNLEDTIDLYLGRARDKLKALKEKKIKAAAILEPMTFFELPPMSVPPSSKEKPIPVPDARETDDRFLDVTQREDAKTKEFRQEIIDHKPHPVYLRRSVATMPVAGTTPGGTMPYMAFNKGKKK